LLHTNEEREVCKIVPGPRCQHPPGRRSTRLDQEDERESTDVADACFAKEEIIFQARGLADWYLAQLD